MTDEKKFATKDALGSEEDFEEIQLPVQGGWIRVRFLTTPELTRLQFLPDLLGFTQLVEQMAKEPDKAKGKEAPDPGVMMAENYKYEAHVAHLAVLDPEATEPEILCETCEFVHAPSLWSVKQTSRLNNRDLDAITLVALRTQSAMVRSVRPFFTDAMPEGSSAPAEHGESIPQTSL